MSSLRLRKYNVFDNDRILYQSGRSPTIASIVLETVVFSNATYWNVTTISSSMRDIGDYLSLLSVTFDYWCLESVRCMINTFSIRFRCMCTCIQGVLLTYYIVYIQRLDIAVYRSEKDVRHSYVYMDFLTDDILRTIHLKLNISVWF